VDWANDWSIFLRAGIKTSFINFTITARKPAKLKGFSGILIIARGSTHRLVGGTGERDNAILLGDHRVFEANNIGWSFWLGKKMIPRHPVFDQPSSRLGCRRGLFARRAKPEQKLRRKR